MGNGSSKSYSFHCASAHSASKSRCKCSSHVYQFGDIFCLAATLRTNSCAIRVSLFPPFLPPVAVVIADDQVGADAPAPSALSVMTLMTTGAMGEQVLKPPNTFGCFTRAVTLHSCCPLQTFQLPSLINISSLFTSAISYQAVQEG